MQPGFILYSLCKLFYLLLNYFSAFHFILSSLYSVVFQRELSFLLIYLLLSICVIKKNLLSHIVSYCIGTSVTIVLHDPMLFFYAFADVQSYTNKT